MQTWFVYSCAIEMSVNRTSINSMTSPCSKSQSLCNWSFADYFPSGTLCASPVGVFQWWTCLLHHHFLLPLPFSGSPPLSYPPQDFLPALYVFTHSTTYYLLSLISIFKCASTSTSNIQHLHLHPHLISTSTNTCNIQCPHQQPISTFIFISNIYIHIHIHTQHPHLHLYLVYIYNITHELLFVFSCHHLFGFDLFLRRIFCSSILYYVLLRHSNMVYWFLHLLAHRRFSRPSWGKDSTHWNTLQVSDIVLSSSDTPRYLIFVTFWSYFFLFLTVLQAHWPIFNALNIQVCSASDQLLH